MYPQDLATALNNMEYRTPFPPDLIQNARNAHLVIVTGASDDLVEFAGAIDDEIGATGEIFLDEQGLIPSFESLDKGDEAQMRAYFKRSKRGSIRPLWCSEGSYVWTYRTSIPHAAFDILEDGEPWCRGIVFSLGALNVEA
jgi:hypothetical protein